MSFYRTERLATGTILSKFTTAPRSKQVQRNRKKNKVARAARRRNR